MEYNSHGVGCNYKGHEANRVSEEGGRRQAGHLDKACTKLMKEYEKGPHKRGRYTYSLSN